jgi:preprotein translocase subunit SecE
VGSNPSCPAKFVVKIFLSKPNDWFWKSSFVKSFRKEFFMEGSTSDSSVTTGLNSNQNAKAITFCFLSFSFLVGFTVSSLLKALSGAFALIAKLNGFDLFKHGLPITVALVLFLYLQFSKNILVWADEVIAEINKVVWPSVKDTRGMTVVVIVMVLISSLIITSFDWFSAFSLDAIIK